MRNRLLPLLGVGMAVLTALPSQAQIQRNCGFRDAIVTRLADKYGESRQSVGLGSNNQIVEVFASLETGTWTIMVTNPAGMSCLVASGQAYEPVMEAVPTRGSDL